MGASWHMALWVKKRTKTRNVWQSLAYSPIGVVVSLFIEYLWNTQNYWSLQCLTAPPQVNVGWTKHSKIIDPSRTTSCVQNSEVTELNLTKVLHNVQKSLPINVPRSKLRYSNTSRFLSLFDFCHIVKKLLFFEVMSTVIQQLAFQNILEYSNKDRCIGSAYYPSTSCTNPRHYFKK